jgi:hypothetical protein
MRVAEIVTRTISLSPTQKPDDVIGSREEKFLNFFLLFTLFTHFRYGRPPFLFLLCSPFYHPSFKLVPFYPPFCYGLSEGWRRHWLMGTWDHSSQRGKGYLFIPERFSNSNWVAIIPIKGCVKPGSLINFYSSNVLDWYLDKFLRWYTDISPPNILFIPSSLWSYIVG